VATDELNIGVRPGDILANKYRVDRVLGVGGMGVVVAAYHLQLEETVALKFLRPEALGDAEAVARFAREARAAVKIKSEHVARVSDVGTLPSGAPYMVMEYLDGADLAAWLKQRGALPFDQAIEFVLQACIALADAHALGITHRDLKPANLFCVRRSDGQLAIKVLDFGISKLTPRVGSGTVTASGMSFTRTSALMGSPLYMSPEQMRSAKDVDAQTDIWALGVVLFELIAGVPPFLAESVTELAIKVNSEPTPAIRNVRPEVPARLEAIIFKCLEKDRRQRFRNVAELALALLPFAPKRAQASVDRVSGIILAAGLNAKTIAVPQPAPPPTQPASGGTLPPFGRTTVGSPGRKTAIGASLAGVVALVAVVGSLVAFKHQHASESGSSGQIEGPGDLSAAPEKAATLADKPWAPAAASAPAATLADKPWAPAAASAPAAAPATLPPLSAAGAASPDPVAVEPAARNVPSSVSRADRPVSFAPPGIAKSNAPPNHPPSTPRSPPATPLAAQPPAQPSAPPAGKPDCNPPYVIDSAGDRQYKPECL
jgi:serine/threonine protein kinase